MRIPPDVHKETTEMDIPRSSARSEWCCLASRGLHPKRNLAAGRVTRIFTGLDNIARSCEVKTAFGKLSRTVVKLMHVYAKPSSRLGLGFVAPRMLMLMINFWVTELNLPPWHVLISLLWKMFWADLTGNLISLFEQNYAWENNWIESNTKRQIQDRKPNFLQGIRALSSVINSRN